MGVLKQVLNMMLHENRHRPIKGELLSIGKQTVNIPDLDICRLLKKYDVSESNIYNLLRGENREDATRHSQNSISDKALYSTFCSANYQCLDVSDYEGANIIHDMNETIPEHYHQAFDFIYNGSCMDNLFDPISFIKNSSKMLKSGGRILHLEAMANVAGAFLHFSPEWFFSYYAINQFRDCKVYAFRVDDADSRFNFDSDLFSWNPFFTRNKEYDYLSAAKSVDGYMYLLVIAEKDEYSTSDRYPQQMQYLHEGSIDWREMYSSYSETDRPILNAELKDSNVLIPFETDHFKYLGSGF